MRFCFRKPFDELSVSRTSRWRSSFGRSSITRTNLGVNSETIRNRSRPRARNISEKGCRRSPHQRRAAHGVALPSAGFDYVRRLLVSCPMNSWKRDLYCLAGAAGLRPGQPLCNLRGSENHDATEVACPSVNFRPAFRRGRLPLRPRWLSSTPVSVPVAAGTRYRYSVAHRDCRRPR